VKCCVRDVSALEATPRRPGFLQFVSINTTLTHSWTFMSRLPTECMMASHPCRLHSHSETRYTFEKTIQRGKSISDITMIELPFSRFINRYLILFFLFCIHIRCGCDTIGLPQAEQHQGINLNQTDRNRTLLCMSRSLIEIFKICVCVILVCFKFNVRLARFENTHHQDYTLCDSR